MLQKRLVNVQPYNRHLLVRAQEDQADEALVYVPDEYKSQAPYTSVEVIRCSPDCLKEWHPGQRLVIPTNMLLTVPHSGEEFNLVLENHVLLGVSEE